MNRENAGLRISFLSSVLCLKVLFQAMRVLSSLPCAMCQDAHLARKYQVQLRMWEACLEKLALTQSSSLPTHFHSSSNPESCQNQHEVCALLSESSKGSKACSSVDPLIFKDKACLQPAGTCSFWCSVQEEKRNTSWYKKLCQDTLSCPAGRS